MPRPKVTDIKPQIPAVGILQTHDFGDSKYYRIACECGCNQHDIDLNVEADSCGVTLNMWTTVKTAWWREHFKVNYSAPWIVYASAQFANEVINRATLFWQVVFKGYIEFEGSTIMNQQQAANFVATVATAMTDVEAAHEADIAKHNNKSK